MLKWLRRLWRRRRPTLVLPPPPSLPGWRADLAFRHFRPGDLSGYLYPDTLELVLYKVLSESGADGLVVVQFLGEDRIDLVLLRCDQIGYERARDALYDTKPPGAYINLEVAK